MENHGFAEWYLMVGFIWICPFRNSTKSPCQIFIDRGLNCDPAGIRTQDHYIKSVMLYQLSYGIFLTIQAALLPSPP
jgi:hypothetical protein